MDIYMGATKGGTRRKHSDEFKAAVLAQCRQSGKSIAGVALQHGLNANMVRVWLRKLDRSPFCDSVDSQAAAQDTLPSQFVAVRMDAPSAIADKCDKRSAAIKLELRRGNSTVVVAWPSELARECGAWLREWLQ
jgi:transposase